MCMLMSVWNICIQFLLCNMLAPVVDDTCRLMQILIKVRRGSLRKHSELLKMDAFTIWQLSMSYIYDNTCH